MHHFLCVGCDHGLCCRYISRHQVKHYGRHSISPDNVAELAWNNVPLELVLFYHDGQLVDESIQVEKMKELMTL